MRGALDANFSFCPCRRLSKERRIKNTTSPVITRNPTPSPAAIIQRCCVLFAFCTIANIALVF